MKSTNRAVAAGLAAALAFGALVPAAAFASPQSELAAASQRLEALGGELSSIQDSLAEKTAELEDTSYKIGEKQSEIEKTEEELESAKEVLGGRMRSSYKTGRSSLIDVLLGSASIDDVISRIYYMDKIVSSDAASIAEVRLLESRLSSEKADLEQSQQSQQAAVDDLKGQVSSYSEKVAEAQRYYDSLDAQIQQQLAEQQAAEENARIAAAMAAAEQEQQPQQASDQQETVQEQQADTTEEQQAVEPQVEEEQQEEETQEATPSESSSSSSSSSSVPSGGGLGSAYAAIGSPYVWGATGPSSFDCSGLVCYCYGYGRGRDTYSMISSLQSSGDWKTSMSQLSVGDLVFTNPGHVGIYVGGGQMIHAPSPGRSVEQAAVYAFYGGGSY